MSLVLSYPFTVSSTATMIVLGALDLTVGNYFTLTDTSGASAQFAFQNNNNAAGTTYSGDYVIGIAAVNGVNADVADRIKDVINIQTAVAITSVSVGATITLTQSEPGIAGDTPINEVIYAFSASNFTGGVDPIVTAVLGNPKRANVRRSSDDIKVYRCRLGTPYSYANRGIFYTLEYNVLVDTRALHNDIINLLRTAAQGEIKVLDHNSQIWKVRNIDSSILFAEIGLSQGTCDEITTTNFRFRGLKI